MIFPLSRWEHLGRVKYWRVNTSVTCKTCVRSVQQKAAEHFGHCDTSVHTPILYASEVFSATERKNQTFLFLLWGSKKCDIYLDCNHLISFLNIFHIFLGTGSIYHRKRYRTLVSGVHKLLHFRHSRKFAVIYHVNRYIHHAFLMIGEWFSITSKKHIWD